MGRLVLDLIWVSPLHFFTSTPIFCSDPEPRTDPQRQEQAGQQKGPPRVPSTESHAPEELQADPEVVTEAVRQSRYALQYASYELKANVEVTLCEDLSYTSCVRYMSNDCVLYMYTIATYEYNDRHSMTMNVYFICNIRRCRVMLRESCHAALHSAV
jgi:hypothetical protein